MRKKDKPLIVVTVGSLTDFNVLKPVVSLIAQRADLGIKMHIRHDDTAKDFARDSDIELIDDEASLFRLFERQHAALLLLANDFIHPYHDLGHRSTCVARLHKIPSLSIQHGLFLDADNPFLYRSFTADKMAVWGPTFKQILIEQGDIHSSRLAVTGNPVFDSFAAIDYSDARADLEKRYSVLSDKPLVLLAMASHYLTSYLKIGDDDTTAFVRGLLEGCVASNTQVLIKPHPHDETDGSISVYKEAISMLGNPQSIVLGRASDSVHSLISAADVVLSHGSTTVFEAMVKQKPAAAFRLIGMPDILRPLSQAYSRFISVESSLDTLPGIVAGAVNDLLGNQDVVAIEQGPFARDIALARQSGASTRVVDLCLDRLRPKKYFLWPMIRDRIGS